MICSATTSLAINLPFCQRSRSQPTIGHFSLGGRIPNYGNYGVFNCNFLCNVIALNAVGFFSSPTTQNAPGNPGTYRL